MLNNNMLEKIEMIAREGTSIVIKLDGGRNDNNFYSVVISGGKLGDNFFRKDGPDLALLLNELINYYNNQLMIMG